jgi:malonyl-CoA O-methyltransferase
VPERGPAIDRRAARQRFERAARTYAGASRLEEEIGLRMLQRLDYIKLAPARILDAGSGPAREARALRARYPGAWLIALDYSHAMLRQALAARGLLSRLLGLRSPSPLCAGLEALPISGDSVGLVWSNMVLHWLSEPLVALREFHRVLQAEGLLMFSTLGPDTLKELRAAAGEARVHQFMDMHDLGDQLVAAGFSAPVMDMEIVTVTYDDADAFLADLHASGQSSALASRPRGLAGRTFREQLRRGLATRMRDARLPATYEVVYGHAWKAAPQARGGKTVVRFDLPGHKRN